ncbi:DUF2207 domain-containing protein [Luteimonas sp. FCS-9]|uniref:DUF2207 domain-containing protein n=1 Tax=Luteimonas sp. FCS-9 TaxID=1547516 RepID=UPI00063E936D|nr:DUF2207 domain-containing protein [Luteimonas sp. FCS-9]KLJ01754.1 hypothetical protein WQ56_05710 [Luteimonas sp. FCS-9]
MRRAWLATALCLIALPAAWAQERVLSDDIEVRVLADGRLDVTERIAIRAEGRAFRHGIVRDLPTRYHDAAGRRVRIDLEVREVLRDGRPEPWTIERTASGLRLRVGDTRHLPTPSEPVYALRYRTARQLAFLDDHDALYFPAIAPGGAVPTERGSVTVSLPDAVPVDALRADGATGTRDAPGRDFHVALSSAGTVRWTLARPLPAQAGWTVGLAFPKGLVAPPDRRQRLAWWLHDHLGLLVALAGLSMLLVFCALRRRRLGRDRAAGRVAVRHAPPPGFSPGGLRYALRMRYDERCLSSDLLAAAVDDHVHIVRERTPGATHWRIARTRAGAHTLPTLEQRALLTALLPGAQDEIRLGRKQAGRLEAAWRAHETALRRRFQPALFRAHGGSLLVALAIALVSGGAALLLSARAGTLPPTAVAVALMLPVLVAFAMLVRAPTREGRQLLDHVEGLRRHLAGADRRGDGAPGTADAPPLDVHRYEALLPYAVALDVEEAWTRRFAAACGAEAATAAVAGLHWYRGIAVTDLGRFARPMGQSLARRLAAVRRRAGRRARTRPDGPDAAAPR